MLVHTLTVAAVATLSSFGLVARAQDSPVVGCLKSGAEATAFVLETDDKSSYMVQAGDGVELSPHVNQRVEVTGSIDKTESAATLKATAIKMVAASCQS
jgi:hypothetical protein